jgi:hypothetical protein
MSKGPGWIQRRLLDIFDKVPDKPMHTALLVCFVFGHDFENLDERDEWPGWNDQLVSVRRALRALAKAGKIRSFGRRFHDRQAYWGALACRVPTGSIRSNRVIGQENAVSPTTVQKWLATHRLTQ